MSKKPEKKIKTNKKFKYLSYLKKYKKADYTIMLMEGSLRKHIVDTDKQAKVRYNILMKQMEHVQEKLNLK